MGIVYASIYASKIIAGHQFYVAQVDVMGQAGNHCSHKVSHFMWIAVVNVIFYVSMKNGSSSHRQEYPMMNIARLFLYTCCHCQVIIRSHCDHGNIYSLTGHVQGSHGKPP